MKNDKKEPIGGANEETIERNLAKMDYPASEDIMQQSDELDANFDTTVKKAESDALSQNR